MIRVFSFLLGITFFLSSWGGVAISATDSISIPVLVYHRFGPSTEDSMTVPTQEFESQICWLKDNHYTVISLRSLIDFLRGLGTPPPPGAIVITVDDGHLTVYREMLPIITKYKIPVTLFIYPSAISNASYALTWEQLTELQDTGLVDIHSHTLWHPNFKKEQAKLSAGDYEKLVRMQLRKSKSILEKHLSTSVDLLAWPFGIHDEWLEHEARTAGYVAAFTIDRRHVHTADRLLALPRYLMVSGHSIQKLVKRQQKVQR